MSESEGQRNESPLLSERGVTTISNTVVSQVAGMAAQEVEGVHMGGGATRSASGVLGSITGSESKTSGISVEIGRTETAIDLKMGIEYNKNILQTVEEVRQRITERVEALTGLRIKELNATITDITFPEQEARRRLGPASPTSDREGDDRESDSEQATDTASEQQAAPESETDEPGERETIQVETATQTEGSDAPEEEAGVEDRPREESETTELRKEQTAAAEASEEAQQTRAESETPEEPETRLESEASEPETPEVRMRRRAEERARRRRSQES